MTLHLLFCAFCAAFLLPAQTVQAKEPQSPLIRATAVPVVAKLFDLLDCDSDSIVEMAEVQDHLSQLWHPVDRDASKQLSRSEFDRVFGADGGHFDLADADGDQSLTPVEYARHLERLVRLSDRDGNGEVTREDVGLKPHVISRGDRSHDHAH